MPGLTEAPVCCAPVGDRCGEGVLWHPEEEVVYWTDINRFLIHRFNPVNSTVRTWIFDEVVSAVLLTDVEETLAVCLGSRLILWDAETDTRRDEGFRLPGWPAVRLNDAAVDPRGALLAGSMRNNVHADGSVGEVGGADGVLFRIRPGGKADQVLEGIGISNTLVWSPDQRTFYFGDSLANTIWKHNFDRLTGKIERTGVLLADFPRGDPDGSSIDEEGYLWNCRYGGGCIVRIAPDGTVDRVIEMPTRNITNCTFGGKNLDTLYVTTAGAPEDKGDRLAGGLFSIKTNVRGVAENRFLL